MSDDFETRLREALRQRGTPDPLVLRRLSAELNALPPRRPYRRRGLAAAAVVVLVLAALASPRLGQLVGEPGPSSSPGDPRAFANDPRLAQCGLPLADLQLVFEMKRARNFPLHFPGWWRGAPELEVDDPALVVIEKARDWPTTGGIPGSSATQSPETYRMCIALGPPGTAIAHHYGPTRFAVIRPVLTADQAAMADRLDPDVYGDPAQWRGTDRYQSCLESAGTLGGPATIQWAFEIKPARDFGRHFPSAGNVPELAGSEDVAFVAVLRGTSPLVHPGASGSGPERNLAPNERNICVVLGSDPASYDRFYLEYVDITGFRVRLDDRTARSSPQPSPSLAAGCGPSSLGIPYEPYATPGTQLGWPLERPMSDYGTVVDKLTDATVSGYEPLQPADPGERSLQLILVQAEANGIGLVYSAVPVSLSDTNADLRAKGALVLDERPFDGQDGQSVLDAAPRDDWAVQVGPYTAALVIGSATAAGIRPIGLYWADGARQWSLHGGGGLVRPEDLVDLARSIYC